MNWLLDTHVFPWVLDDSVKLPPKARATLRRSEFRVDVGKLVTGGLAAGLELLAFEAEHAVRVARLPRHHADPFDRALVAQAQMSDMTLMTHDALLVRYGKSVQRF